MRLISYSGTTRLKRGFSLAAIALIGIACVPSILNGSFVRNPVVNVVPVLILGGFWVYFLKQSRVFHFADEILDCVDHLKVRRGCISEEIPFYNISGVDLST